MKTKKLIIGAMIAAGLTSGAFAADMTIERQKELCNKSKDKIWVEKTKACIPKNPCMDSKYEAYCDRTFKDINYAKPGVFFIMHYDVDEFIERDSRYVSLLLKDENYITFEFSGLTDTDASGLFMMSCAMMRGEYGGSYFLSPSNSTEYVCKNVSEEDCKKYADRSPIYNSQTLECKIQRSGNIKLMD
jgi:hypothetical protein